jgi:Holliday junction DNA helicase RuvA
MISFLQGRVVEKTKTSLVILTSGGVGYEIRMSPLKLSLFTIQKEVSLFTYLKVSDSALDLYGFETADERDFFTTLMTVSGVGPKTAMSILSLGAIDKISGAIARGDVKYLTGVSGLGKKTAERLVVELKGKVMNQESGSTNNGSSDAMSEVIEALVGMGYGRDEAKNAVQSIDATDKTTEQLLRLALKYIK